MSYVSKRFRTFRKPIAQPPIYITVKNPTPEEMVESMKRIVAIIKRGPP